MKILPMLSMCAFASPAMAKDVPKVEVKQIALSTVNSFGQEIRFPQGPGQIAAWIYVIPPGEELPVHRHSNPRLGYILDGSLQVTDLETGESHSFGAGQFAMESVNHWHKGANAGRQPVRLLVIDLQLRGEGNSTELKP